MNTTNPKSEKSTSAAASIGIAVVVIRENNSIVIAHSDDDRMSATIPFGSKIIYDALELVFNISPEELKDKATRQRIISGPDPVREISDERENCSSETGGLTGRTIAQTVRRHLEDILTYTYYSIKNHRLEKKINNRLIITGDFSDFPGLKSIGESVTGLECEVCVWNYPGTEKQ